MRIVLPAGIGDIFWVCQKLITTGDKYDFEVVHERGKQILDMLPQLVNSVRFSDHSNGDVLYRNNARGGQTFESIKNKGKKINFLSCNTWVDSGNRLEDWLPDLDTDWELGEKLEAPEVDMLDYLHPMQNIGIYTSSLSNISKFNPPLWNHKRWFELIYMINQGKDSHFVIVGADYDIDLINKLSNKLTENNISHSVMIEPLPYVIQFFREKCDFFLGRASGIGILADNLDVPSIMLYPWHETKLINSWCKARNKQIYQGMLFDDPFKVLNKIPKNIKERATGIAGL